MFERVKTEYENSLVSMFGYYTKPSGGWLTPHIWSWCCRGDIPLQFSAAFEWICITRLKAGWKSWWGCFWVIITCDVSNVVYYINYIVQNYILLWLNMSTSLLWRLSLHCVHHCVISWLYRILPSVKHTDFVKYTEVEHFGNKWDDEPRPNQVKVKHSSAFHHIRCQPAMPAEFA